MTAPELQQIFRELPAGPFVVHVSERTPIEVAHSDFASIAPGGAVLSAWDTAKAISILSMRPRSRASISKPQPRLLEADSVFSFGCGRR
jgi:hypothetical protein